jgi:hypothetical protein
MKQDEQCCGNCRCWRQDEDEEVVGVGRCCRRAPRPETYTEDMGDDLLPRLVFWRQTAPSDWCAEWQPFPLEQSMIKRRELTDPTSCMSKARDDEMTFVLLGRDGAAPATVRFWVQERIRRGKNRADDPQIIEALECARSMESSSSGSGV